MYKIEWFTDDQKKIVKYLDSVQFPGYYKLINKNYVSSIDQKCTYDVLYCVCLCVKNYVKNIKTQFSVKNFFVDKYSKKLIENKTLCNGKAGISITRTSKEYDKFFGNIFQMLTYSEIFDICKNCILNVYSIKNH